MTGFADIIDPRSWPLMSTAGYAFPVFFFLNFVMLVAWTFVGFKYLAVPLVGFIICYSPVMKYCPFNMEREVPEGSLKVLTLNTWLFVTGGVDESCDNRDSVIIENQKKLITYLKNQKCDIICLQEALINDNINALLDDIIKPEMRYRDSISTSGNSLVLISRYPIIRKEKIKYESTGNLSGAFYVSVKGKEVIVINNHLESNHFSEEEKTAFHVMAKGNLDNKDMKTESKFILRKLADAAVLRAPEADAVASFIRMHKGRPMILCGDFNDIPISYCHRTIAKELTDCYSEVGNGPGFSYHKNAMYVRIDNIMCSEHFTPYSCDVDKSFGISDHYAIISYLK